MLNLENTFANPTAITNAGYEAPKRFLILGLGESGVAMAKWCLRNGASVRFADTRDQSKFTDTQNAWLEELKFAGLKDWHQSGIVSIKRTNSIIFSKS
jgi:UDP-N-acetylmuramoylalanine--D-glutamate ligase